MPFPSAHVLLKPRTWAAIVLLLISAAIAYSVRDQLTARTSGREEQTQPLVPLEPLLTEITNEVGLEFVHSPGDLRRFFFPSIMSGGCAFLDFDRDGRLDIYLVNGSTHPSASKSDASPRATTNRLYRQHENGRFVDVTHGSGLANDDFGMGVAVGDVNNDGFPDLYATNYGPDRLYLNRRDGTFDDVTRAAGIENLRWAASAGFVDFDRDGWLDLYVTNYVDYFTEQTCLDANGRPDFCGPQAFFNAPDKLFRNTSGAREHIGNDNDAEGERDVHFEDVSVASGIAAQSGAGLGVVFADFNGDHWPDIYVANDRNANFLWVNQHDGTFADEAVFRGTAFDAQGRPQASMGIALADLNNDSAMDLYITHLEGETNALYLSDGFGLFHEHSSAAGLLTPSFPWTGFGTAFADLDHDGHSDILIANGRVKRSQNAPLDRAPGSPTVGEDNWTVYAERNLVFLGTATGRFQSADTQDPFCQRAEISRGLAIGDIDADGDLDVLVVNTAGPARLYRNDSPKNGRWLKVRALDPQCGGRDAYGAVVTVVAGESRWTQQINPATSYLSSNEPIAHFGLGHHASVNRIEVIWPTGQVERFGGGPADQLRTLERGTGEAFDNDSRPSP